MSAGRPQAGVPGRGAVQPQPAPAPGRGERVRHGRSAAPHHQAGPAGAERMMRAPHSLRRGFTLIELLVAISILAVVAVLGWRALDGIIRSRVAITGQIETTRGMQLAFAQLQSDAEHMADPAALQKRPFLLADTNRMVMVRNVFRENEASALQVVSYQVQEGVLTRRESASTRDLVQLDMLWKAATSNADTTAPVILQKGVSGMK